MRVYRTTSATVVRLTLLLALLSLLRIPVVWAAPLRPSQTGPQLAQGSTGTIAGYVFNDRNGNQVLDGDDAGVGGAVVELFDAGGNPVGTPYTTSGSGGDAGFFEFRDVPPGNNYRVKVTPPSGYVTTSGDERVVTVLAATTTEVGFALTQLELTPAASTPTSEPGPRSTPTLAPTFTATSTPLPTATPEPTETPGPPTGTAGPSPTASATVVPPTATATATPAPTGTFFPLTPIATYITTTPGVRVTTTAAPVARIAVAPTATSAGRTGQLPSTGSGTPLVWALAFGAIMIGAGLARRLFFHNR